MFLGIFIWLEIEKERGWDVSPLVLSSRFFFSYDASFIGNDPLASVVNFYAQENVHQLF